MGGKYARFFFFFLRVGGRFTHVSNAHVCTHFLPWSRSDVLTSARTHAHIVLVEYSAWFCSNKSALHCRSTRDWMTAKFYLFILLSVGVKGFLPLKTAATTLLLPFLLCLSFSSSPPPPLPLWFHSRRSSSSPKRIQNLSCPLNNIWYNIKFRVLTQKQIYYPHKLTGVELNLASLLFFWLILKSTICTATKC